MSRGLGDVYKRQVSYQQMHGFSAEQLRNTTHLVWATGGGMVPEEEMNQYLAKGR